MSRPWTMLAFVILTPYTASAWDCMPCGINRDHSALSAQRLGFADGGERDLPTVTPSSLLVRQTPGFSNLQWAADGESLIGEYADPAGTSFRIGSWSTYRSQTRDLAGGRYYALSPDDRKLLLFEQDAWVLRTLGVRPEKTLRWPGKPGFVRPAWSRSGRYVAFVDQMTPARKSTDEPKAHDSVRVVEVAARADSSAVRGASAITIVDIARSGIIRKFNVDSLLTALEWGPSDNLYVVPQANWDYRRGPYSTIERMNLRSGRATEVFRIAGVQQTLYPRISPNGRFMAVACDVDDQKWSDFVSLALVDLDTGRWRRLTDKVSVKEIAWSIDGNAVFVSALDGLGWTQLYQVDLQGGLTQLTHSESIKVSLRISPNGKKLSYIARDGYGRVEIRTADIPRGIETTVSTLHDPTENYRLGRFEAVQFPSADGVKIAAYVIYPPNFVQERKYPLFVDVHGGGPGSDLNLSARLTALAESGPLEWHAWAALGFIVFVPDYRSSGEYGPRVAGARYRHRDYNGIEEDMKDVESGTLWMLQRPYIDSSRIAVFGTSAGGARVNLLLTRSSMYKAGVLFEPIGSGILADVLESTSGELAGSEDWEDFYRFTLGQSLKEDAELYRSGFLFDGYRSQTPTLILVGNSGHGAADSLSAEVLLSVLRQYGVPSKMLRYLDEGHGLADAKAMQHAFAESLAWIDAYLDIGRNERGQVTYSGNTISGWGSIEPQSAEEILRSGWFANRPGSGLQ